MVSGWCPHCKTLQKIKGFAAKIPYPNNPKALDWHTEAHPIVDENDEPILDKDGKIQWCPGAKKAIL